jgi:Cu2+-exporting ATPase
MNETHAHTPAAPALDDQRHRHHGAGHYQHAGHDPAQFQERFWLTLVLTAPIVVTSEMVMDWFGYSLEFPGIEWVGPVLGSIVFWWGGWPFLEGALDEVHSRQPGMMLLISMAIAAAYAASLVSSLGWFDLQFWWELALLVTIMLLGHWQEMRAVGQARGALTALAELLPDDAERVRADGSVDTVTLGDLAAGDVVLVRSGARVPADGPVLEGEAALDESMITLESRPVAKRPGDRVVAGTVATDSALRSGSTRSATTPRWPAFNTSWPRPSRAAAGPRPWPTASPPCRSMWQRSPAWSRSWPGGPSATSTRRSRAPSPCWSSPARTPSAWRSRS